MTYQVLARKWRPHTFSDMVGQEHVVRALSNALDKNRLHHAFLFTGTRGVGKTTIARILSKCLNCESGPTSTPCGVCGNCREIDEGRYVDLIEVDAASRTKVDETRELLEDVPYAPTRGRYKVYLIDEVHMFSNSSFNALLKTLEEPPEHVKFLLATTDPRKVPVTVLSRCLQFNLKRLTTEQISSHMAYVTGQESIEVEPAALMKLAIAADGSIRDGLSLLDQAIAFGAGRVLDDDVSMMLGSVDKGHVLALLEALAASDGITLMAAVDHISETVTDYAALLNELAGTLHQLGVEQKIPGARMIEEPRLSALVNAISAEDVQLFYQIAITGRRDLMLAPDPKTGLEMTLLRMLAFKPDDGTAQKKTVLNAESFPDQKLTSPPEVVHHTDPLESSDRPDLKPVPEPVIKQTVPPPVVSNVFYESENPAPVKEAVMLDLYGDWSEIVDAIHLQGITGQLAMQTHRQSIEGNRVECRISPEHEQLLNKQRAKQVEDALCDYFKIPITLHITVGNLEAETPAQKTIRVDKEKLAAAEHSIETDDTVQRFKDTFEASVIAGSVKPKE